MRTIFREIQPVLDASFTIREELATQFAAPFHFHRGYELLFILKGQGKFYGGNQVMNFGAGDVYLFGPNFPHFFINERAFVESGETGHSIAIQFRDDSLERVFGQLPELRAVCDLLNLAESGIKFSSIKSEIQMLANQMLKPKNAGINALLQFITILSQLSGIKKPELTIIDPMPNKLAKKDAEEARLDAVYEYVLSHFNEDISSKKAASLACMQEAAFCRYFKRRAKKTFSQFVNTVRVTHSTHLLAKTESSISAICHASGFNNLSYFNRQFKGLLDCSPFEYRKQFYETVANTVD